MGFTFALFHLDRELQIDTQWLIPGRLPKRPGIAGAALFRTLGLSPSEPVAWLGGMLCGRFSTLGDLALFYNAVIKPVMSIVYGRSV